MYSVKDENLAVPTDDVLGRALEFTLAEEGGWANHKDDRGGATNWGVTIGVFRGVGRMDLDQDGDLDSPDLDGDGDVDAADLKLLTQEGAKEIYRRLYWPWDDSRLPAVQVAQVDPRVQIKVFDIGVNAGPKQAAKLLQRAAGRLQAHGPAEDGDLGPATLLAVLRCDQEALLAKLCDVQAEFYLAIVARNPSQNVFLKGWLKRARRVP